MFILDNSKNDTSVTLDLLRAIAAQMVCVGHAFNFSSGQTITQIPVIGVLFFFVLSGFVIAHTLVTKSANPSYGLIEFGIERFARIYSAFLPAILIIGLTDYAMRQLGSPLPGDPADWRTFLGNLTMRQGLPNAWGVSTFGSAGHLTSVAVEFHIYFFVGALFFLARGRNWILCVAIALAFSAMPLGYLKSIPGSDHTLFALWLAGFGAYFIAQRFQVLPITASLAATACIGLAWYWVSHRTPNDYDLSNYPPLALAFFSLVIFSQQTNALAARKRMTEIIRFAADYSFSLFLIHLTIVKVVCVISGSLTVRIVGSVLLANLLAVVFALCFERHYRRISGFLKSKLRNRESVAVLGRS